MHLECSVALHTPSLGAWYHSYYIAFPDFGDGDSDDSSTVGFKGSSFLPPGAAGYNMAVSTAGLGGQGGMYMNMNGDNYQSGGDTSVWPYLYLTNHGPQIWRSN